MDKMLNVETCEEGSSVCSNGTSFNNVTQRLTTTTYNPEYARYLAYLATADALPVDLILIVTSCIYILGIFANCWLLAYLIKFKRYRSPIFAVILSLACCDTGTCLFAMLNADLVMYRLIGPWWLCKLSPYLSCTFFLSSVWHMVFFSMLRFYQLVFPLKAQGIVTVSLVTKICVCLWISTAFFTVCVPTYCGIGLVPIKGHLIYFCVWAPNDSQIFIETAYLLIPNILMIFFHIAKHVLVRKQRKMMISEQTDTPHRQSTDARAVTVVIMVFCVTSWPQLFQFYVHYVFGYPTSSYHIILNAVASTLEYINSAFNPWIYVFCAQSVRKDVMNMITSCCRRK